MKLLLIGLMLLVVAACPAAAQNNPRINLTALMAPGFWQFQFTDCDVDADATEAPRVCHGTSEGGYVCVLDSFLRDALNWSNKPADDAPFRKKAISATLSGNHLHVEWAPKPSEHINSSHEDVYFDDQTHWHGMQVTLAWAGTEFRHYGFMKGEVHRVAEHCLGPPGPDKLWRLFAFPGY